MCKRRFAHLFYLRQCQWGHHDAQNIYDLGGEQYGFTRSADPYLTAKISISPPHSSGMHLDIGCGTGNYTMALAAKGLNFTGIDPSEKMLDVARAKAPDIPWRVGSAENIPADNDTFDNIIATLTLHHWDNLDTAFAEIHRVLKTQGKSSFTPHARAKCSTIGSTTISRYAGAFHRTHALAHSSARCAEPSAIDRRA